MTSKEFKIWLIRNNHTQKSIAETLNVTERTISNYVSNERFPFVFVLALVCVQKGLTVKDLEL
ncbi:hypothetical protein VPH159E362A_0066 [Vibrio phage 159E36-2a]